MTLDQFIAQARDSNKLVRMSQVPVGSICMIADVTPIADDTTQRCVQSWKGALATRVWHNSSVPGVPIRDGLLCIKTSPNYTPGHNQGWELDLYDAHLLVVALEPQYPFEVEP